VSNRARIVAADVADHLEPGLLEEIVGGGGVARGGRNNDLAVLWATTAPSAAGSPLRKRSSTVGSTT
jgi:hypothetical protein